MHNGKGGWGPHTAVLPGAAFVLFSCCSGVSVQGCGKLTWGLTNDQAMAASQRELKVVRGQHCFRQLVQRPWDGTGPGRAPQASLPPVQCNTGRTLGH